MLSLFDVKYNTVNNTYVCNIKKGFLKKAVVETSQSNILVITFPLSIILCSIYICTYIYIYANLPRHAIVRLPHPQSGNHHPSESLKGTGIEQ